MQPRLTIDDVKTLIDKIDLGAPFFSERHAHRETMKHEPPPLWQRESEDAEPVRLDLFARSFRDEFQDQTAITNHRTTAETMCSNHLNELFMYEARNLYNSRASEYHNWDHALDVAHMSVSILNMNRISTEHIPVLLAAAIGHDVFHTCTTPDDERRSAEWMRKWGGINGMEQVERSAALIDATAFHFRELPRFHELDNHEALMEILLDADLAGLAARYDVFLKQNEAVSKEVQKAHRFSDEELMSKRLAFVDFAIKSAEQSLMFRSPWSRRYLQPTAVENLRNYKTDIEAKGTPYP